VPPDSSGQRLSRRQQPVGIGRAERIETAVQEPEQVMDDFDVAQSQLLHRERFGASAPAALAAGLSVEDLPLPSQPGTLFR